MPERDTGAYTRARACPAWGKATDSGRLTRRSEQGRILALLRQERLLELARGGGHGSLHDGGMEKCPSSKSGGAPKEERRPPDPRSGALRGATTTRPGRCRDWSDASTGSAFWKALSERWDAEAVDALKPARGEVIIKEGLERWGDMLAIDPEEYLVSCNVLIQNARHIEEQQDASEMRGIEQSDGALLDQIVVKRMTKRVI